MIEKFILGEQRWYGWVESPPRQIGFAVSPIFVQNVNPLKTGQGLLQLTILQPFYPGGAAKREIILKINKQAPDYLVSTFGKSDSHTAIILNADLNFFSGYCPDILRRHFLKIDERFENYPPDLTDFWQERLSECFGTTENEILLGTQSDSFDCKLPPMPKKMTQVTIGRQYTPLNSWLIARGVTPKAMEDKWFIYLEGDRLLFRRSWTGIPIYDVDAQWRGDSLYLGSAWVNRNPKQYGETDGEYDKRLLTWLIDALLCRAPAGFPTKSKGDKLAG